MVRKRTQRRKQVSESKKILKGTTDDLTAAHLLNEINPEKNNVLDATDLNESLKLFNLKHGRK